ncbi:hypothetical protein HMPREF0591_2977 [Mycobacterium parascrofulaceum ATCC BAA-614]|uniref:Uncharacterized protein n=1 Tax=Mycobacterium parascrofulaceum ATCC BAA-614 TaxID=525368 RepID=D5P9Y3_9MYCO|nr:MULTISPECIES: hypothetical protein [Mycobacterium]EFG77109.1 hypothetical protein HMPREF0591_2977 [Mycobacterium parascrofulaceum ATCC BAA-614]OCB49877.1 hypothetical protein A9X02_12265 [Mycobacterium malmoense]
MNAVLAPARTPALAHFPDSIADLPQPHRVLLALVVAHRDAAGGVIPWHQLLNNAVVAISSPDLLPAARSLVDSNNILRTVKSVVGDLLDYDLLTATDEGLDLSARADQARHGWNGEFTELTQGAKEVLAHARE